MAGAGWASGLLIGEAWSEWQNRNVRVLYVAPGLPGKLSRITDGVQIANPGDRIEIESGTYHESVVVAKHVELVAADGASPELQYRGTALTITGGSEALIEGLFISQRDKQSELAAVLAQDSAPTIRHCQIDSLEAKGRAEPTVEDCTISEGGKSSGIRLRQAATGTFLRNRVFMHGTYCIDVESIGSPVFKQNNIYAPALGQPGALQLRGEGVVCVSGLRGGGACAPIFEDNRIGDAGAYQTQAHSRHPYCPECSQERVMVTVFANARPTFRDNILSGGATGMRVFGGAAPIIEGNMFTGLDYYGLWLDKQTSSDTVCAGNTFRACYSAGVHIACSVTVVDNRFEGGPGDGIVIDKGGAPTLRENHISRASVGIRAKTGAHGLVVENKVVGCTGPCLILEGCPAVESNYIGGSSCQMQGIVIHGATAQPTVTGNTLNEINHGAAIAVLNYATAAVEGNTITACLHGIVLADGARGRACRNTTLECNVGFLVRGPRSNPVISQNEIRLSATAGVLFEKSALGRLTGNTIVRNKEQGVLCVDGSDPFVSNNVISENELTGVEVGDGGMGTFVGNTISLNYRWGVLATERTACVLRGNKIQASLDMGASGIGCGRHCRALFEKNTITDCDTAAEIFGSNSDPLFLCNVVRGCSMGVRVHKCALGRFLRNKVTVSRTAFEVAERSTPSIHRNTVQRGAWGVLVESGRPSVTDNDISACTVAAVHARGPDAQPTVSGNSVSSCAQYGLVWENRARGTVQQNQVHGCPTGCLVQDGATPDVQNNMLSGCTEAALRLGPDGCGVYKTNTFETSQVGILCEFDTGPAVIEANTVRDNTWGIHVTKAGTGATPQTQSAMGLEDATAADGLAAFSGNSVSGSAMANVLLEGGGHASFERNKLHSAPVGVLCRAFARGRFVGNLVRSHGECGVRVQSGSHPYLQRNVIEDCPQGIGITDNGRGLYDGNILRGNGVNMHTATGGDPVVMNSILSNVPTGPGLVFIEGGLGRYINCEFNANAAAGVLIRSGARPLLENCQMQGNASAGVLVEDGGIGTLKNCRVQENGDAGIRVQQGGQPTLDGCEVFGNPIGMLYEENSGGEATGCNIHSNPTAGIQVHRGARPCIHDSKLHHLEAGIVVLEGGRPRVHDNSFRQCQRAVDVLPGGFGTFTKNIFKHNVLAIKVQAEIAVQGSTFAENDVGILACSGAQLQCTDCPFQGLPRGQAGAGDTVGVQCTEGGRATVSKCSFNGLGNGVEVRGSGSSPVLQECTFVDCIAAGVRVADGASPRIEKGAFRKNAKCGIHVDSAGDPFVTESNFEAEDTARNLARIMNRGDDSGEKPEQWQAGILLGIEARGRYNNNNFQGNMVGICTAAEGAEPVVKQSCFRGNAYGILFTGAGSSGKATSCLFQANYLAGVCSRRFAKPSVGFNLFIGHFRELPEDIPDDHWPQSCGLECTAHGAGTFEDNVFAQGNIAVRTTGLAQPTVRRCLFVMNDKCALEATDAGRGEFEECAFRMNRIDCLVARTGDPTISLSAFDSPQALCIRQGGRGTWTKCAVTGLVQVAGAGSSPFLQNLTVLGMGVQWESGAGGEIEDCEFGNIFGGDYTSAALEVRDAGTEPVVTGCTFINCPKAAVFCHTEAGGSFGMCTYMSGRVAIELRRRAAPNFTTQRCEYQKAYGVYTTDNHTAGSVSNSTVFGCEVGVLTADLSQTSFDSVEIYDTDKYGVHCAPNGRSQFRHSMIFDCRSAAVFADEHAAMDMSKCDIYSKDDTGAVVKDAKSDATMAGNRVRHGARPLPRDKRNPGDRADLRREYPQLVRQRSAALEKQYSKLTADAEKVITKTDPLWALWQLQRPALPHARATHADPAATGSRWAGMRGAARLSMVPAAPKPGTAASSAEHPTAAEGPPRTLLPSSGGARRVSRMSPEHEPAAVPRKARKKAVRRRASSKLGRRVSRMASAAKKGAQSRAASAWEHIGPSNFTLLPAVPGEKPAQPVERALSSRKSSLADLLSRTPGPLAGSSADAVSVCILDTNAFHFGSGPSDTVESSSEGEGPETDGTSEGAGRSPPEAAGPADAHPQPTPRSEQAGGGGGQGEPVAADEPFPSPLPTPGVESPADGASPGEGQEERALVQERPLSADGDANHPSSGASRTTGPAGDDRRGGKRPAPIFETPADDLQVSTRTQAGREPQGVPIGAGAGAHPHSPSPAGDVHDRPTGSPPPARPKTGSSWTSDRVVMDEISELLSPRSGGRGRVTTPVQSSPPPAPCAPSPQRSAGVPVAAKSITMSLAGMMGPLPSVAQPLHPSIRSKARGRPGPLGRGASPVPGQRSPSPGTDAASGRSPSRPWSADPAVTGVGEDADTLQAAALGVPGALGAERPSPRLPPPADRGSPEAADSDVVSGESSTGVIGLLQGESVRSPGHAGKRTVSDAAIRALDQLREEVAEMMLGIPAGDELEECERQLFRMEHLLAVPPEFVAVAAAEHVPWLEEIMGKLGEAHAASDEQAKAAVHCTNYLLSCRRVRTESACEAAEAAVAALEDAAAASPAGEVDPEVLGELRMHLSRIAVDLRRLAQAEAAGAAEDAASLDPTDAHYDPAHDPAGQLRRKLRGEAVGISRVELPEGSLLQKLQWGVRAAVLNAAASAVARRYVLARDARMLQMTLRALPKCSAQEKIARNLGAELARVARPPVAAVSQIVGKLGELLRRHRSGADVTKLDRVLLQTVDEQESPRQPARRGSRPTRRPSRRPQVQQRQPVPQPAPRTATAVTAPHRSVGRTAARRGTTGLKVVGAAPRPSAATGQRRRWSEPGSDKQAERVKNEDASELLVLKAQEAVAASQSHEGPSASSETASPQSPPDAAVRDSAESHTSHSGQHERRGLPFIAPGRERANDSDGGTRSRGDGKGHSDRKAVNLESPEARALLLRLKRWLAAFPGNAPSTNKLGLDIMPLVAFALRRGLEEEEPEALYRALMEEEGGAAEVRTTPRTAAALAPTVLQWLQAASGMLHAGDSTSEVANQLMKHRDQHGLIDRLPNLRLQVQQTWRRGTGGRKVCLSKEALLADAYCKSHPVDNDGQRPQTAWLTSPRRGLSHVPAEWVGVSPVAADSPAEQLYRTLLCRRSCPDTDRPRTNERPRINERPRTHDRPRTQDCPRSPRLRSLLRCSTAPHPAAQVTAQGFTPRPPPAGDANGWRAARGGIALRRSPRCNEVCEAAVLAPAPPPAAPPAVPRLRLPSKGLQWVSVDVGDRVWSGTPRRCAAEVGPADDDF